MASPLSFHHAIAVGVHRTGAPAHTDNQGKPHGYLGGGYGHDEKDKTLAREGAPFKEAPTKAIPASLSMISMPMKIMIRFLRASAHPAPIKNRIPDRMRT